MRDEVISLVEEAGRRILSVYNQLEIGVEVKKDNSPITDADKKSSEYLIQELSKRYKYPVIEEETFKEEQSHEIFWLIDPLDGTKDFLAKNGEFTVNVALIKNGKPILGVVGVPALNVVYAGEVGKGSIRKEGEIIEIITTNNYEREHKICADSRFHSSKEVEEFCILNRIETVLRSGSSVKLCKIAEGAVDVYPRFGPTSEWDIAAGHCVLAEAGGTVKSLENGEELRYGKNTIKNPPFIAGKRGLSFDLPKGGIMQRISL